MKGNSPTQTSFILIGFVELSPSFWNEVDFRFDYSYTRKLEYLFPDNNPKRYYPTMQAFSLKIIFRQLLSKVFLLEEGLGPLALNDRSYSDINEWDYGVSGWFAIGLDLKSVNYLPLVISVGSHFGLTVTNTTASFNTYCIQTQYFFLN
ncbi:MAG: hypothetical protein KKA84_03665 [Bacteroidetes bacterium]|nr:hypothetical protein [Bacteroidota bacterium]